MRIATIHVATAVHGEGRAHGYAHGYGHGHAHGHIHDRGEGTWACPLLFSPEVDAMRLSENPVELRLFLWDDLVVKTTFYTIWKRQCPLTDQQ